MLPHLARGVGDKLMAVFEVDPETGIGQYFGNHAVHFKQFFLGHCFSFVMMPARRRLPFVAIHVQPVSDRPA
jgi:hypothetical protein